MKRFTRQIRGRILRIAWWVAGGLIAMPAALGMSVFQLNVTSLMSPVGHMPFGAVLGLTVAALNRRPV